MESLDFEKQQKDGKVELVKPQELEGDIVKPPEVKNMEEEYPTLLFALRTVRQTISTAPTFTPRSFAEQIQIYKNGTTYRLYVYVDDTWRYTTLT